MNKTSQPRMLRMKQLTSYTSLSRAYIYQKIAEGDFPPGSMISSGIRIWDRATVDSWINERMGRNL
jgi:predicted DNA-binding transcriptional regulator AlpA